LKSRLITVVLVVAIIALLVVYYFLGTDYRKQRQAYDALAARVNEATLTLTQTPEPSRDLERRLAAAKAKLATVRSTFPSDLLADEYHVKAIPLITTPWSLENIGKGYHVFRIEMVVSGSFAQVNGFVSQLESGRFAAIAVENLGMTRQPAGGNTPVVCDLNLAIYTQFTTSG